MDSARYRHIFEQPNRRLRNRMSSGVRGRGISQPSYLIVSRKKSPRTPESRSYTEEIGVFEAGLNQWHEVTDECGNAAFDVCSYNQIQGNVDGFKACVAFNICLRQEIV